MLTKTQKDIASKIANDLLRNGLLVADELEWFIREGSRGRMAFKSNEHYFEFEDYTLDLVEERRKFIEITDVSCNSRFRLKTITEVHEKLNVSKCRIYDALNKGVLLKNRYKIAYVRPSIKELI